MRSGTILNGQVEGHRFVTAIDDRRFILPLTRSHGVGVGDAAFRVYRVLECFVRVQIFDLASVGGVLLPLESVINRSREVHVVVGPNPNPMMCEAVTEMCAIKNNAAVSGTVSYTQAHGS
jgi:hypothetical protein